MSALYLDASVLVSLLTSELVSEEVSDWLEAETADVVLSDWTRLEFASAVSLKVRIGQLSLAARVAAMAALEVFTRALTLRPIGPDRYRLAVQFLDRPHLSLRGPDALHLAICVEQDDVLVTRDQRMAQAAAALGVRSQLL